ncbi:hypothetical protein BV898_05937 [Hypsibius exemplaris]|uniref:Uncharacterized protein n=1 Tax=Hypsibius exemplaris TaxID=2072580 RepID=A0A1W0WY70_HYPEX|nr:hypothetical protein BV898_05937 [Hypsibius exemplaris]
MDADYDQRGDLPGSCFRVARRSPSVRSWLPTPYFLFQQIFFFFTRKLCTDRREDSHTADGDGMSELDAVAHSEWSEFEPLHTATPQSTSTRVSDFEPATSTARSELDPFDGIVEAARKKVKSRKPVPGLRTPAKESERTTFGESSYSGEVKLESVVRGVTVAESRVEGEGCRSFSHSGYFRSATAHRASSPCPCFLNESDPSRLRDFLLEENIADSAHFKSVHQDYGIVTKQCSSLRDEVDRLEASLGLLGEFGMTSPSPAPSPSMSATKEVRVVLYGDLGSALNDELPKDSLSESLYSVNVKLLSRLEAEKQKVEKRNKEQHAMTAQLQELVATVGSFQAKFEERVSELHSKALPAAPVNTANGFAGGGGTESGFGDSNYGDAEESSYAAVVTKEKTRPSLPESDTGEDVRLKSELRNIVTDLRKVAQEIAVRETGWIDEQKSWTLFAADLSARVAAVQKLMLAVKSSGAIDRAYFEKTVGLLQADLSTCLLCIGQINAFLRQLGERPTGQVTNGHLGQESYQQRVTSWQEKSSQVEKLDTNELADIQSDYALLEERYQSTVKRLQNSAQEKLLLESSLEKIKDEVALAQYEKEFLLKKNERSLMSLNAALSEKSAIESALNNVTADLDSISSTRWALESSTVIMRDSIAGLQSRVDSLQLETSRQAEEKESLIRAMALKQSEVDDARGLLDASLQENFRLKQEKDDLQNDIDSMRKELESMTKEATEKDALLNEKLGQLKDLEVTLGVSEEAVALFRQQLDSGATVIAQLEQELEKREETILDLRSFLDNSLKESFQQKEQHARMEHEMETQIEKLFQAKQMLEAEAANGSEIHSELEKRFAELDAVLQRKLEEIVTVTRAVEERDREITDLKQDVTAMDQLKLDLEEALKTVTSLRQRIDDSSSEKNQMQSDMDAAIDRLLGQLEDKASRIVELEREIDRSGITREKLQADLDARMADLGTVSAQLAASAAEVDRLQERFSGDLTQLQAKNADFRANIALLESCRADFLAEIDRLKGQLAASSQDLEELRGERTALEEGLGVVKAELLRRQEADAEAARERQLLRDELASVSQERLLAENNQRIYSDLIQIICATILNRGGGAGSAEMSGSRRHVVFTPDGMFMDDGTVSPDQTMPSIYENDSGFVGSQSQLDVEGQLPLRRRSSTSSDLKGLLDQLTGEPSPRVPPSESVDRSKLLQHDLQRAQAAVQELQADRAKSDYLAKSVQNLTDTLQEQTTLRDNLSQEISQLTEKVDFLSGSLTDAESAHEASLRELDAKDRSFAQFTAQLSEAEKELERLRESGNSSSESLHNISLMFKEKEREIAALNEELQAKEIIIDGLNKQCVRTDGRVLELLNRVTTNDTLVADLSHQLRETEMRMGSVDNLRAREEAQKALGTSLDAKIAHLQEREKDIRVMETKLAGFVTDQLELANRESESVKKAFDLDLRESELRSKENDLTHKMVELLRTEDKLRTIEADMEEKDNEIKSLKKERAAVEDVNVQLKDLVENLQGNLIVYEDQARDRDILDGQYEGDLSRLQADLEAAKLKLQQMEQKVEEGEKLLQSERTARADLEADLERTRRDQDSLNIQLEQLPLKQVAIEAHDAEVERLLKLLADRSTQVASLGAEEKRLRHLLQSSEAKLTTMRQTFEDMEDRLKNKNNGRNTLDTQFNTLNVLYADLLVKYRTLSDAHDEMEIEMVRNKDEHRDVKRELDKLSDFLRRHLGNGSGSRTFTITREDPDREAEVTISKDMISSLRANLEQLIQERLYDDLPTENRGSSLLNNMEAARSGSSQSPEVADMRDFRGRVMDRLFENTSRENIIRDELLNHVDKKYTDRVMSSNGSN